jgi:hypothetical protein
MAEVKLMGAATCGVLDALLNRDAMLAVHPHHEHRIGDISVRDVARPMRATSRLVLRY